MSNVSFNEEPQYQAQSAVPRGSAFTRLAIRWGFAKDEKGAERFLLCVVGVCVLLAIAVFFFASPRAPAPETPRDADWPQGGVRR